MIKLKEKTLHLNLISLYIQVFFYTVSVLSKQCAYEMLMLQFLCTFILVHLIQLGI